MTASEIGFLILGLTLGIVGGSLGILTFLRRPQTPREVRLTVTQGSVPGRSTTLSSPHVVTHHAPATGGPADPAGLGAASNGTAVPIEAPGAAPRIDSGADPSSAHDREHETAARRFRSTSMTLDSIDVAGRGRIAVPVQPEGDLDLSGLLVAVRTRAASPLDPTNDRPAGLLAAIARSNGGGGGRDPEASAIVAQATVPDAAPTGAAAGDDGDPPAGSSVAPRAAADSSGGDDAEHAASQAGNTAVVAPDGAAGADPAGADSCAEARLLVTERCGMADRLRAVADGTIDKLREHQRAYDGHIRNVDVAEATVEPRALRDRKEAAQRAFRQATPAHASTEAMEAAARAWLAEINRINQSAREATIRLRRERDAANRIAPLLERLSVEADAARITAEAATAECHAAREALATCEEAHRTVPAITGATPAGSAAESSGSTTPAGPFTHDGDDAVRGDDEPFASAITSEEAPILRLLRGDRQVLASIVGELAGSDELEQRRWRRQLGELVEAIVSRAIEASALEFPAEHPFWGLFTRAQDIEIARSLASLGYRFDGFGGFADERTPSQRDLSLAIGYAGLDPGRIRRWPTEAELPGLYAEVTVSADEYLAEEAGGLTLGEMVTMLGRRADGLTDLWNAWGRIRPMLLSDG